MIASNCLDRCIRKALKSCCRYKVLAIGFNRKGDLIGYANNHPMFSMVNGSMHAERKLIMKYGSKVRSVVILRVGNSGNLLPIKPCANCQKMLDKLNVTVQTIEECQ